MRFTFLLTGIVAAVAFIFWSFFQNTGDSPIQTAISAESKPEVIVLRFGHNTPVNSALHLGSVRFAEEVAKRSKGKIKVEIYPAQELGNDHQMVEMARRGELDILLTPTAKMSVPVPSMQYADLPFFFPSREDLYNMLDGEPGRLLLNELRKIGLVGVTFWENGFKHFTGNAPLRSPDDFAGKKIRVMKSRIIMDQFNSFGAEPVPIDFHSTRQALADNVVDGQENPLVAIVSMGFHEVQSDLTLSEHAYLGYVFSISEKTLKKLPSHLQSSLIDSAKAVTPWERQETQRREAELIEKIKAAGVNVYTLSEEQRLQFAARTTGIAKKFEGVIGTHIISKTEELLLEKYGVSNSALEPVVIGINADLSSSSRVAGLAIKRGVELAVAEANRAGGVLGRPLKVIARDHRITPSLGKRNIDDFIRHPFVVAVVGGKHSAVIVQEIEQVQRSHMPYLIPWAAAAKVIENGYENNYLFRASVNDRLAANYLSQYTLQRYKKPAIIVENTIWGRSNLEQMRSYMAEQGMRLAVEVVYNRGQDNYHAEVARLVGSGADSVIMVANSKEGSLIVKRLAQNGKKLAVVSHWGIIGGSFYEENRKILESMDLTFLQTFSFNKTDRPVAQQLKKSYFTEYGLRGDEQIKAQHAVAQSYDLTQLLIKAIEKAGTTDRTAIKLALEALPVYEGAVRRYAPAFTAENHDALGVKDFCMARYSTDGKIVAVNR